MTAISVKGLDHVVVRVADLDRALGFYCGVLGLTEERRIDRIGLVQLRAGTAQVDLLRDAEAAARQGANMDHFCLNLSPFDAAAIRAHLAAHGVDAGAPEPRFGADGYGPSIYIEDPEGNTVELKGPPDPSDPRNRGNV